MSEEYGGDEHQRNNNKKNSHHRQSMHNVSIEYKDDAQSEHDLVGQNFSVNDSAMENEDYIGYDVNLRQSLCRDPETPLTPMWEPDNSSPFKFRDEETTQRARLSFHTDSPTNSDDLAF